VLMRLQRKYILALIALIVSQISLAQNDFGLWFGGQIKAPITKQVDLALETEMRLGENATQMDTRFISPSVKWKAHKHVRVGAEYRLSSVPFNSSTTNRSYTHRYGFDLEFRKIMDFIDKKSKLGLSMRLRSTTELETQKRTKNTLRYKINFDYNIPKSKLKPYISGEFFYRFNNQVTYTATEVIATNAVNKLRLKIGVEYPVKKRHTLKFYSLMQKQILSQDSEFIVGVSYGFRLKMK
jgi:hypothetical protein